MTTEVLITFIKNWEPMMNQVTLDNGKTFKLEKSTAEYLWGIFESETFQKESMVKGPFKVTITTVDMINHLSSFISEIEYLGKQFWSPIITDLRLRIKLNKQQSNEFKALMGKKRDSEILTVKNVKLPSYLR